jgi:hypothetical protein
MNHPYSEFEKSKAWKVFDRAISELEKNRDLQITTERKYVIGFLCKQFAEHKLNSKKKSA